MVSIIVPVYNAEKYLKSSINSILNQSFKDYEIILINDGSTDHSGEICTKYSEKYCNIYTYHIRNQGVSNARNEGIKKAKGKFIIFMDSDDELSDGYLEKLFFDFNEKYDLLITDVRVMDEDKKVLKSLGPSNNIQLDYNGIKKILLSMDAPKKSWVLEYVWNKVYIKKIIDKFHLQFDTNINLGEDFVFNCNYFRYVKNVLLRKECPYYYYVRNSMSLTRKFRSDELDRRKIIYSEMVKLFTDWNILREKFDDIKYLEGQYGFGSMNSLFLKDCHYSYKEKLKYLNTFLESDYYDFILLFLEQESKFTNRIWYHLIKKKMGNAYLMLYGLNNLRKV